MRSDQLGRHIELMRQMSARPDRGGLGVVPIPKFASSCGVLDCELQNRRTVSVGDGFFQPRLHLKFKG
jgi:hypothetical protein